ncbi:MAG TPA: hypothetical protein VFM88_21665 [Vicinamibacteria bacterium]|nr:hypothetical protein [Vicinamibacteria bacterium]
MRRGLVLLTLPFAPLLACASAGRTAPPSPLQQRELESRTYASDTKGVMRAVLAALQDDGFMVRTADADLGVITATRESAQPASEAARVGRKVAIVMTYGLAALLPGPKDRSSVLEATANVASFGQETRLRINFQLKRLENGSKVKEVRTILDPRAYQEFFAKVDKVLFLQRESLEPSS